MNMTSNDMLYNLCQSEEDLSYLLHHLDCQRIMEWLETRVGTESFFLSQLAFELRWDSVPDVKDLQ